VKSPEDVEVGRDYLVPCIEEGGELFPVLGEPHSGLASECISPLGDHFHFDWRFMCESSKCWNWDAFFAKTVKLRKMECLRLSPTKPLHRKPHWPFSIERLHRLCENKKLGKSDYKYNVCIHRETPILNSCGECPSHGLIWDLETGKLKYQLPFYLVTSIGDKGKIENGHCEIRLTVQLHAQLNGRIIRLCDANGEFYPNCYLRMSDLAINDVIGCSSLTINDNNCGPTVSPDTPISIEG